MVKRTRTFTPNGFVHCAIVLAICVGSQAIHGAKSTDSERQTESWPCPQGWIRDSNREVSLCHPRDWELRTNTPVELGFESPHGFYVVQMVARDDRRDDDQFYREYTQIRETFDQVIPPQVRRRCMDRPDTPSPVSTGKGGQIIADGGLRSVFVPRGVTMFVFIGCSYGVYTSPGQHFYKTMMELEHTITFLRPPAERPIDPNEPPDPGIQGVWSNTRSGMMLDVPYRFEGTRFFENNVEVGTFAAQGGRLVIQYRRGRTVSCRYRILGQGRNQQMHLRDCSGDFPRVFIRR